MFLQSSDGDDDDNNSLRVLQPLSGWPSYQHYDDICMAVIKIAMERNCTYCRKKIHKKTISSNGTTWGVWTQHCLHPNSCCQWASSLYVPVSGVSCVPKSLLLLLLINLFSLCSTKQLSTRYHINLLGSANQVSLSNLASVVRPIQSSRPKQGKES